MTRFVFALGWANEGAPQSESFSSSNTPRLTIISTSFLNITLCTLVTGSFRKHNGFASYLDSKSTRVVFHVPSVRLNRSSNFLKRFKKLIRYLVFRLIPAQDIHFFYTRSHLSALQNCALIFSTNFQFISYLSCTRHNLVIELCTAPKTFQK